MAIKLKDLVDAAIDAKGADGAPATESQRREAMKALLEGVDRETANALQNEAIKDFNALNDSAPTTDEGLMGLRVLVDAMKVTREVQTDIDSAEDAKRQLRESLAKEAQDLTAEPTKDEKPEGEPEGEPNPEVEPEAKTEPEGGEPEGGEPEASAAPEVPAAEAVVASGKPSRRFSLDMIPRAKTGDPVKPEEPAAPGIEVLVASGVRDHKGGDKLADLRAIAVAAQKRISSFPRSARGAIMKGDIASFRMPFEAGLVASGANDQQTVDYAATVGRLGGGSLVAAGGWCAPSTTLYDIPQSFTDASVGLVDVPEIQVTRGGVRFRPAPDFAAIYGSSKIGQVQTEEEASSADVEDYTKTFYRIPCDDFDEVRADVIYTGIEAGILANHAYPEQTEAYVSEAIAAHAHRVNYETIKRMVAEATALDLSTAFGPTATGSLNAIEWVIVNERARLRAAPSLLLTVVLPDHYKAQVRADLANRAGGANQMEVTDEQISSWFSARGARVQWVYDWQDAFSGVANGVGASTVPSAYPTDVRALVYPEGTFVRGRGEVVNLEAVYDSTNIRVNDFLRLFMEEQLVVVKRAYRALHVKLPVGAPGILGAPKNLGPQGAVLP